MQDVSPALVWIFLPLLIAGGATLVTAALMQARTEVAIARHREALAEARALLATQHRAMAECIRAVEETARREALEQFMGDIRVEERQCVREEGSRRKAVIVQERVCFRNIPLTGWIQSELPAVEASAAGVGYLPQNIIRAAITNKKPA